jgi:hypothetical protein
MQDTNHHHQHYSPTDSQQEAALANMQKQVINYDHIIQTIILFFFPQWTSNEESLINAILAQQQNGGQYGDSMSCMFCN